MTTIIIGIIRTTRDTAGEAPTAGEALTDGAVDPTAGVGLMVGGGADTQVMVILG